MNRKIVSMVVAALVAGLAGCGQKEPAATEPADTAALAPPEPTAETEAHGDIGSQPLPLRLAFMSGHVEAGLALYKAGAPEMAAKHLLHPVSESYAEERAGLDALGFDPALFETVSTALEAGRTADDVAAQLAAAEAHLAEIADRAGGDAAEIIAFLMDTVIDEYGEGVADGVVVNAGEYQDAFGFTVVAIQRVPGLPDAQQGPVLEALEALRGLWPEAPLPPELASPVADVNAAAEKVAALVASSP
ncbi:MAG: hypothetical protein AAGM16_14110 [Pseudomonadota bacterium]